MTRVFDGFLYIGEFLPVSIERNVIISVLKLTKSGPVSDELVKNEAKIPSEIVMKLLGKLQNDGLVYFRDDWVEADSHQRLRLAVHAMELGVEVENVAGLLQWKEFEDMAAHALEQNLYSVTRNYHFKHASRRWEIDVIACRKPLALCIDCKHWHRSMYPSALSKIVQEQTDRTSAFADFLPNPSFRGECISWNKVKLIPAVLSLVAGKFKFCDDVPIIPVLQLQDFLNQLPAYVDSLRHFTKASVNRLDSEF